MIQIDIAMPDSCRECWFLNYDMYSGRTSCAIEDMTLANYFKALDFEGRHEECLLMDVPDNNVGDMISRQAAIDIVKFECGEWEGLAKTIEKGIKGLQCTQPKRKKGKWIPQDHNKHHGMMSTAVYYFPRCSMCGESANYTNFCPNCGADMRGEQE